MSSVSLGMGRPEWIKFIVSAVAHKKLNLFNSSDRNRLIFDQEWGLLFQTFLWKRDAMEHHESYSGFGIGSLQIQSQGSLSVLETGITSDRLCYDLVNELMLTLKKENLNQNAREFAKYFDFSPNMELLKQRLLQLVDKPIEEKKRGIMSAFVWIVDSAIQQDYASVDDRANAFSVANQFIRIVEDLGAENHAQLSKVMLLLCSEKPGKMNRGISNFEIASLIHELLKTGRTDPIVLSFAVYDMIHDSSPTITLDQMDSILRESYGRLPADDKIQRYIDALYARVSSLLFRYVPSSNLMSYCDFAYRISPEKIKRTAVLWEYSLIAGELEEMLRKFISDPNQNPPYQFYFEDRWNSLSKQFEQYWQDVIGKFEGLTIQVLNNHTYLASFQSQEEYLLDIPNWFEVVGRELVENFDLKSKFKGLLNTAGQIGESIKFDAEKVTVLKKPSPTHPLIARDSFYQWFRTLEGIWK